MNKVRRKSLAKIEKRLKVLCDALGALTYEEQKYYDNMPEGIQNSERGKAAEKVVSDLGDAFDSIDNAIDSIRAAIE